MEHILNLKKSEEDTRDWNFEKLMKSDDLPLWCDHRNKLQPVRNQGNQGTCYAQSAACMKEWQENRDYGLDEYLSPQFFYNNRNYWNNNKKDGNDKNEDYGMTGRDVMRILKDAGICLESEYPYGIVDENVSDMDIELIESAKKHRIKSYARVSTLEGLKRSLFENGPCLIAFPVYNYTDQMWNKKEGDSNLGGHAMTVVGYTEESFIIRNSWGLDWGDNGYSYYYFNDWGAHWEIWTTIDNKTIFTDNDNKENESKEKICYRIQMGS